MNSVPECSITYSAETRLYGFSVRPPSRPPHWQMQVFDTLEGALAWVDPHHERVWLEPGDADEAGVLVSRAYKPGSVMESLWF